MKVWTAMSRPCLVGQTDNGQLFLKSGQNPDRIRTANRIETDRIRTAERHRTRFSGKSGQKRDKDRTRTVLSVSIPSAVRILSGFYKKAVPCLSVRLDKDETDLSGLSLSLSADVLTNSDQIWASDHGS